MNRTSLSSSPCRIVVVFVLVLACAGVSLAATETLLHQFIPFANGYRSESTLVPDSQGNLYGTTYEGGAYNWGTVYRLTPGAKGSWTQAVIHSFGGGSDGIWPTRSVVLDSAGNVYGVTSAGGGTGGYGIAYELSPSNGGWVETILHVFSASNGDGVAPFGGVAMDSAGNLYGANYPTVFELSPSATGWTETIIHKFSGRLPDCANPQGVTIDASGNLYGVAISKYYEASSSEPKFGLGCEVLFELSPSSGGQWAFTAVRDFTGVNVADTLTVDADGNIYGATQEYGGQIFKLLKGSGGTWTWKLLYTLNGGSDGSYAIGGLTLDGAGHVYGSAESGGIGCSGDGGCGTVFELTADHAGNWTNNVLYSFQGGLDGDFPFAGVFVDKAGKVYGTTYGGGPANAGTVFQLVSSSSGSWSETQIYLFPSTDGDDVYGGLVADRLGNLYGTTIYGGTNQCNNGGFFGCGTVFEISRNATGQWQESVVYSFTGVNGDGNGPVGSLVFDAAGNLYGATEGGGATGGGTIFELSPGLSGSWTEKILYSFVAKVGSLDGLFPVGSLIFDSSGNLYGTTQDGGVYNDGTAFMLSPSSGGGWVETVIHNFRNNVDGSYPLAGMAMDLKGNLYGTTWQSNPGAGIVFGLSPSSSGWTETTLHRFSGRADGAYPQGPVIFDAAGNLYGTTAGGGIDHCSCGVVFELSPNSNGPWTESVLYSFSGSLDGAYPYAGVSFDPNGNLYGTAAGYGSFASSCGVIFELSPASGGGWAQNVLHSFAGYPSDGCTPKTAVLLDSSGNLYGTTQGGGIEGGFYVGGGTAYEITQ